MEFTGGLILGAVLGVIADRLFTYLVEKRVYVTVCPSFQSGVKGEGFSLNVTNEGFEAMPPYRPALCNPCTTLYLFDHERETERLPGQKDVFTVWLDTLLHDREHLLSYFTKTRSVGASGGPKELHSSEMTPEESQEWVLRLVIDDSEDKKVLYQNDRVGVALVEILRGILENGRMNATWEQGRRAQATNSPWVWLRDRWRLRKELRSLGIPR